MSSGGESGSTTSTTKTEPWKGQQPYYKDIFANTESLYNSGALTPQAYQGQTVAPFSPETLQAQQGITQRATAGSPLNAAASQQLQDTISGRYLDPSTNPGFQQGLKDISDAYSRGTAAQTDAAFARSGSLGGSAYNEMTGVNNRAFADSLNKFAGDLYGQERQRQLQGTLLSPQIANQDYYDLNQLGQVGAQKEGQQQAQIASDIERFNIESQAPFSGLQRYSSLIGGNLGGTTTQSSPYYQNRSAGVLGGGALGLGLGSLMAPAGATGLAALGGPLGIGLGLGGSIIGGLL